MLTDRPVVLISSFLAEDELLAVESAFVENLSAFQRSEIIGKRLDAGRAERKIRSSRFLIAPDDLRRVFLRKLRQRIGEISWDRPYLAETDIEVQLTISESGDFFRRHNDSTDAMKPSRQLSYVYYAHREPKQFTGGELVIEAPEGEIVVVPERNMLVIFPSIWKHEVHMVHGCAKSPLYWRITVNGWVHEPR